MAGVTLGFVPEPLSVPLDDILPSAIADIQALAFVRQLQVAFPTFVRRLPRMSGLTASGSVLSTPTETFAASLSDRHIAG